jgi:hypothetical protein
MRPVEGDDDTLADKPHARSPPLYQHASGSNKKTLDRHPLDAAWNRVSENRLESARLPAVHCGIIRSAILARKHFMLAVQRRWAGFSSGRLCCMVGDLGFRSLSGSLGLQREAWLYVRGPSYMTAHDLRNWGPYRVQISGSWRGWLVPGMGESWAVDALHPALKQLVSEVQSALDAKLFYAAITVALAIPDVCSGLESDPNAVWTCQGQGLADRGGMVLPACFRISSGCR